MKKFISTILVFFLSALVFAESNTGKFWNLWNAKKKSEAVEFLHTWEKKSKKDPELYVCFFNMYIAKASKEQMYVQSSLPPNYNGQYMEAQNDNGDKIYMYSLVEYDDELCSKAFEYINKGLSYNPKRLDMHFGKAQLYFMRQEYQK